MGRATNSQPGGVFAQGDPRERQGGWGMQSPQSTLSSTYGPVSARPGGPTLYTGRVGGGGIPYTNSLVPGPTRALPIPVQWAPSDNGAVVAPGAPDYQDINRAFAPTPDVAPAPAPAGPFASSDPRETGGLPTYTPPPPPAPTASAPAPRAPAPATPIPSWGGATNFGLPISDYTRGALATRAAQGPTPHTVDPVTRALLARQGFGRSF